MHRIATVARLMLVPASLIADFGLAWLPVAERLQFPIRFALGYVTLASAMLAFHRRSMRSLIAAVAIVLALAWALETTGGDPERLLIALLGMICAALPAVVREAQCLAGDEIHMGIGELRLLWRRRRGGIAATRTATLDALPMRTIAAKRDGRPPDQGAAEQGVVNG